MAGPSIESDRAVTLRLDNTLGQLKAVGFSEQHIDHLRHRLITANAYSRRGTTSLIATAESLKHAGLGHNQNFSFLDNLFEIKLSKLAFWEIIDSFKEIQALCPMLKAAKFTPTKLSQFLSSYITKMHIFGFKLEDSQIISFMYENAFTPDEISNVIIQETKRHPHFNDLEKALIAFKTRSLSNAQVLELVAMSQAIRLLETGYSSPFDQIDLCVGAFDAETHDDLLGILSGPDYAEGTISYLLLADDLTRLFKLLFTIHKEYDGWHHYKSCCNFRSLLDSGLNKEQIFELLENIPAFRQIFDDPADCLTFKDCLGQLNNDLGLCCQILNESKSSVSHLAAFSRLALYYSSTEKAYETWQTLTNSVENYQNLLFAPELLKAGISLDATCDILNSNPEEMLEYLSHFLQLGCDEKDLKKIALNWEFISTIFPYAQTKQYLLALAACSDFWKNNFYPCSRLVHQMSSAEQADNIGLSLAQTGQIILEIVLAKKTSYALVLFEAFAFSAMKNERYQALRAFIMEQDYDLKTRINILADHCELLALEENVTLQSKEKLLKLIKQTAAQFNATIERIRQFGPKQKAQILKLQKSNAKILKTLRRKLVSIALGRPLNRREIKLFAHPQTLGKILNLMRLVYGIEGGSGFGQRALCEQLLANLLTVLLLNYAPAQEQAEQKAVTAMNKWLFNLDKNAIRKMGGEELPIQGNFEIRERLVAAGFKSRLWEEGIEIPVSKTQSLTDEEKKNQVRSASFELIEIALMIGITQVDDQPLSLDKAKEIDSHEKAQIFTEQIKNSELAITTELSDRINHILQTIAELEKQKVQKEAEQACFHVTIKKDLFTEALAGTGVPGCFNPRGIHREMPFVHGAEVNAGFIQVFNDHGIQVANAVVVYEEQGAYVYPGYNGTAYDMDKIFAQALIELSRLVPAILLDSTSAGFNTLQKFAAREKRTFKKNAAIFTSQYFDAGTIDKENGTLTMKNDFYIITEESIKAQEGFDQPAAIAAEKDDKFPSINWQALANMFLQKQALRPFLAIIGNVRQKVQAEGQLVIDDSFYDFISRAILEKVGQTDPDLVIEIADLVLDFLESQSWPMDIQTAV